MSPAEPFEALNAMRFGITSCGGMVSLGGLSSLNARPPPLAEKPAQQRANVQKLSFRYRKILPYARQSGNAQEHLVT